MVTAAATHAAVPLSDLRCIAVEQQHGHEVNKRDEICRELQAAYALECPSAQIAACQAVLSNPDAERLLSPTEFGNIHWNKAIAHTKASDGLFNDDGKHFRALDHHIKAVDHMHQAMSSYDTADNRKKAEKAIEDMKAKRDAIVSYLAALTPLPELRNSDPDGEPPRGEERITIHDPVLGCPDRGDKIDYSDAKKFRDGSVRVTLPLKTLLKGDL